ncbi:zf-HC2 domain-containing protein [candidate division KSB1 bacterium]|nr:zf-HC2 domain-containing protein [candidate division KSB1 bacterium]
MTTYGLGEKERRAYDQHLAECPACREKINHMQRRLRELNVDNKTACAEKREVLEAYALGQLDDEKREEVLQHISECHACNAFLAQLSSFPDLLKVAAWDIPIPPHFAGNIAAALEKKWGASPHQVEDSFREMAEEVKAFLNEIRLTLLPLEPAWGFRGEQEFPRGDFVDIEHPGGDLSVNVGAAGVIVELYSNREKYLDDGESDAAGRVVFEGMKPGIYKFKVHGHRIASAT